MKMIKIIEDINLLLNIEKLKDYIRKENILTYTEEGETYTHFSKYCQKIKPSRKINKTYVSLTTVSHKRSCKECFYSLCFQKEVPKIISGENGLMVVSIAYKIRGKQELLKVLKEFTATLSKNLSSENITLYFKNIQLSLPEFGHVSEDYGPIPEFNNYIKTLDEEIVTSLKINNTFLTNSKMLKSLTETALESLTETVAKPTKSSGFISIKEITDITKALQENITNNCYSSNQLTIFKREWLNKKLRRRNTSLFIQCETYNEVFYFKSDTLMVLPTIILKSLLAEAKKNDNNLTGTTGLEVDALSKDDFETLNTLIETTPSVKKAYLITKTI